MSSYDKKFFTILKWLSQFQQNHPYIFSFIISTFIAAFTLFFTAPIYVADMPEVSDTLEFINIETYTAQAKRISSKEISTTTGQSIPQATDRATGLSEDS